MPSDFGNDGQWERVASELRACRDAQQRAWGDVDNATLGRYLADDVTVEERRQIETALDERPELRQLTDLVSDVLRDCEPVSTSEPAARPAVLPFRAATPTPKTNARRWRQWSAVAAAACLLFALAYTVLPKVGDTSSSPGDMGLRDAVAYRASFPPGPMEAAPGKAAPTDDEMNMWLAAEAKASSDQSAANKVVAATLASAPILDRVAMAGADMLNWAGENYESAGDLDRAAFAYHLAYNIRASRLDADAPPTVEARQRLGDVYQVALNMPEIHTFSKVLSPPSDPTFFSPPHTTADTEKKEEQAQTSAYQLRECITRQSAGEVRKSVVPILTQNLRDAKTPQAREKLGRALAELGPAAQDAIPVLKECLANAQTPEEQAVVLRALGELGPAGGQNAAPQLVPWLNSASPAVRRAAADALIQYGPAARDVVLKMPEDGAPAADQPEWASVKKRIIKGAEGRVGVQDAGELFSPRALKEGRNEIRELARNCDVEVFAETAAAAPQEDAKLAKDRASDLGVNGVYFVIQRSPVRVDLYIGEALRDRGFDAKEQEHLRQVVETAVSRQDYDQGLLEGVRFVARFQAVRAAADKGAKPDADPTATKLLADARAARAVWKDFPGFTADLDVNVDGKVVNGHATVSPKGDVTLKLPDDEHERWARRTLASVVGHRLDDGSTANTPCAFEDDVPDHPLGRAVRVLSDEFHSSYRIRDRQVIVVNRDMKDARFTITVMENVVNKEDKFLPACFVVNTWDAKTDALTSSETHRQTWKRVEAFDLPESLTVVTAAAGKQEARSLKLSNLQLTPPAK